MKKQILSEEFKRMQKLAGLITEEETEENITKEELEQIKQEVFNKVTNSPEVNQKAQELVNSLPKDAVISLAKNLSLISNINEDKNISLNSVYSKIFNHFLKNDDLLTEIRDEDLSIIFDKLNDDPNIQKEDIERLKIDTAKYLSELTNKSGGWEYFIPLLGVAISTAYTTSTGVTDIPWYLGFSGVVSAIALLLKFTLLGYWPAKMTTSKEFSDFATDKINKYRSERGESKLEFTDFIRSSYPEIDKRVDKFSGDNFLEKFDKYSYWATKIPQGKLFNEIIEKKYKNIHKILKSLSLAFFNKDFRKWSKNADKKYEPLPASQFVDKSIDVEQEYQKLLKQNGLKDSMEIPGFENSYLSNKD